jgi:Family of unknown function (DUF6157)
MHAVYAQVERGSIRSGMVNITTVSNRLLAQSPPLPPAPPGAKIPVTLIVSGADVVSIHLERIAFQYGPHMTKALHTTTYRDTFIQASEDCPAQTGTAPPLRAGKPTVAGLQYAMMIEEPYAYTSDEVIFTTSAAGRALAATASKKQRQDAVDAFYSKGQACMRASALGKQFGWGVHADAEGRIAIYAIESARYRQLAKDPHIKQLRAMRSKRA